MSMSDEVERLTAELTRLRAENRALLEDRDSWRIAALNTDTSRLDWLGAHGRIARFSDGWNVWDARMSKSTPVIHKNIRQAIDDAMKIREHQPKGNTE